MPPLKIFLEDCLLLDWDRQRLQRTPHKSFPDLIALLLSESRISQRIGDADSRDNPVRADRERDRDNRTHMHNRDSCAINFLNHRCTASSTGSSRTGQDDRIDMVLLQFLSDFLGEGLCRSHSGSVSNRGVELIVELPDDMLLLEIAEDIDRKDAV